MSEVPVPGWVDRHAFPFRPRRVDLGGEEWLSVVDVGSGPTVVFSHGTPTWSYEWRHLLRRLSARYRCIAPDHLGFGLSARPEGADYRPEAHAARFGRLLEALGVERHHLVVHDFGGPFALDSASAHPERVASLTVLNSFAWAYGDSGKTRFLAWLAGTWWFRFLYGAVNLSFVLARSAWGDRSTLTRDTWPPYLAVFPDAASRRRVLWALARSMRGSAAYCASLWERRDRLSTTPTLLLWGLADSAFPPSALARWRSGFPHAVVEELPSAGHWPHEEQPERCAASLEAFLGEVEGQEPGASAGDVPRRTA